MPLGCNGCNLSSCSMCEGKTLVERIQLLGQIVGDIDQLCEDMLIERVKTVGEMMLSLS